MGKLTENDEHGFSYKVSLRLESLKKIKKNHVNVLDAFAGRGFIWNQVSKMTSKQITVTPIDNRWLSGNGIYLRGDNEKYLQTIKLNDFDIIDLDAYGIPFKQLEIILNSNYQGCLHVTVINVAKGNINRGLLEKIGYPKGMVKKCPTIFSKKTFDKLCLYLSGYGVNTINYLDIINEFGDKNYFYFWPKKG